MAARRAYEVSKVLEKTLAMHRDPAPEFRGVNYDGLIVRYTDDQAPVANVATAHPAKTLSMISDRPTAPGWYWYALPGEWTIQPVLVSRHEGELYYCRDAISQNGPEDGFLLSGCNTASLWSAEPIPAPVA